MLCLPVLPVKPRPSGRGVSQFMPKEINSHLYCRNCELISLKGCPNKIGGDFYCNNNQLKTLEFAPTEIDGCFDCSFNQLVSFKNCPPLIYLYIKCNNNNLSSFEYLPEFINGDLSCEHNKFNNFEYFPKNINGNLNISNNNILIEQLADFDPETRINNLILSDFNLNKDEFFLTVKNLKIQKEQSILKQVLSDENTQPKIINRL